ncbi:MAG: hypothetical protein HYT93_04590 [Parcubacteria group bacterium]|nr:hypothetical protein [Parcubacteria group bacterium]
MTKKSFLHALLAELYIIGIVSVMQYGKQLFGETEETILIPMAMLSLFVLSAAVMGYLFVFEPMQLYLDGKKKEAVHFFLSTILVFAVITVLLFFALFILNSRIVS